MKLAIITMGCSGSSELTNELSSKINVIPNPDNHLYPNKLLEKYGRNVKVIFITRNIKDVIKSILQGGNYFGPKWIKKHYTHLNSNFKNYFKILEKDTLNFEKLYDSYVGQKIFDILFIKYEYLYNNHQGTKDMISYFLDVNLHNIKFPMIYKNKENKLDFTWYKSLQKKINRFDFFKHIENKHIRKFFICSWGGCGSTLFYKYLNNFGKSYHIHERNPKKNLCYPINYKNDICVPTACAQFSNYQIENHNLKNYTFIFLIRNPVKCIYSRFINNKYCNYKHHLKHIFCDIIELKDVINSNKDLYKLNEFYDNYTNSKKQYNILVINFDNIDNNIENINRILKIPKNNYFPKLVHKDYNHDKTVVKIYETLSQKIDKIQYKQLTNTKNKTFNMITTSYNNIKSTRLEETIFSINKNLENDLMEKYFILLEVELPKNYEYLYNTYIDKNIITELKNTIKNEFITLLKNEKIEIYLIKNRPTYQYVFNFCNNYNNIIWVLINSDIHFPNWNNGKLKLLLDKNYDEETFVLTRYNIYDDLTEKIKKSHTGIYFEKNNIKYKTQNKNGSSIDSWIFKTPFNSDKINLNFEIGRPECDGRMNFQLSKIRKVTNPCLDIISIHKHTNWSPESYNKINHKGNIYNRADFNKKLDDMGLKRLNIPFSKMKKNIKIAHLINPFKCSEDNPSFLYYSQPVIFKSMRNAQLEARKIGIDIQLYTINYPEDDEIIPKYFIKLPHLKKSTMSEFPKICGNKKLPIIQEMFDSILKNSDADYIIFTNTDIGVQKHFYIKVHEFINKDKLKSFIINRRDIPKFKYEKRLTENDLDVIYNEKGTTHQGKDCFIMERKILEQVNMNLMFTGYPPWGYILHDYMTRFDKKTYLFTEEYLTFHMGSDKIWKNDKKNLLWLKNIELSKKC